MECIYSNKNYSSQSLHVAITDVKANLYIYTNTHTWSQQLIMTAWKLHISIVIHRCRDGHKPSRSNQYNQTLLCEILYTYTAHKKPIEIISKFQLPVSDNWFKTVCQIIHYMWMGALHAAIRICYKREHISTVKWLVYKMKSRRYATSEVNVNCKFRQPQAQSL